MDEPDHKPNLGPGRNTIRDMAGNVLLFSWNDFVESICEGPCCFVCGRQPYGTKFNEEHIVPNWVLRTFNLHKRRVKLSNGNEHQYGTYTVPCCKYCNSEMARCLEDTMSMLVSQGADAIQDHIASEGGLIPFTWMALVFLKLHLKDRRLRYHLDRRKGNEPISANYTWVHMHHLHALARAFHIPSTVLPEAVGSMFVFPIIEEGIRDTFDMLTFTEAQTLYIRLGKTGIVAVFDDSCAASNRVRWLVERIDASVSWMQAREIAVHFAMANLDLENRPLFWTIADKQNGMAVIGGTTDHVPRFRKFDRSSFGELMACAFPVLPPLLGYEPRRASQMLAAGELSFLLDDSGNFIRDHRPMGLPSGSDA